MYWIHSQLLFVLKLEDPLVYGSRVVGVVDLTYCHEVEHSGVLACFVILEAVDSERPVIDVHEVDELAIFLDISVGLFD